MSITDSFQPNIAMKDFEDGSRLGAGGSSAKKLTVYSDCMGTLFSRPNAKGEYNHMVVAFLNEAHKRGHKVVIFSSDPSTEIQNMVKSISALEESIRAQKVEDKCDYIKPCLEEGSLHGILVDDKPADFMNATVYFHPDHSDFERVVEAVKSGNPLPTAQPTLN